MKRVHIVGISPRTGTTLLAECMRFSFEIDAFDAHEESLASSRQNASIYLSKCPKDICIVRPRLLVDPRLFVICMMRDPRDVIASRHCKNPERYWTSLAKWKSRFRYVKRLQTHPRFLVISYERLVCDPDKIQRQIVEKFPFLKLRAKFSEFANSGTVSKASSDALGGVRAISGDRIGNWRKHLPRVAGQLQSHGSISGELIELGYEVDEAWLKTLDGVLPDLSPSHGGDGDVPVIRRVERWLKGQICAVKGITEYCFSLSRV